MGVSGWLSSPSDVNKPWDIIDANSTEPFALRFELDAMLRMGNSLNDVLFSYAWDGVAYTVVSRTILGALYAGLWPLGLVKAASVLDNPFSVAVARADKAGKVLAHALIDGVQGKRPVTLIGYSIGARVIYACLRELAEQHAFGIVESVVLMGAPVPSNRKAWRQIRGVVAARVVNVYSTEDYILGFLYRSTKVQFGVAGLQEVKGIHGIENVDMSKVVNGHDKYRFLVGTILAKLGFSDLNFNRIAEQERALEVAERKKEQAKEQANKGKPSSELPSAARKDWTGTCKMQGTSHTLINLLDVEDPLRSDTTQQSQKPTSSQHGPLSSAQMMKSPAAADSTASLPMPARSAFPMASISRPGLPQTRTQSSKSEPLIATLPQSEVGRTSPLDTAYRKQDQGGEPLLGSKTLSNDTANEALISGIGAEKAEVDTIEDASEDEGQHTASSDDEDGLNEEFGELNMVEPVPMDDFDYGLM